MDIVARLIELEPGSAERVSAWAKHIDAHRADAEATLCSEGVAVESWFSLSLGGKDYLLCYMRADSLQQAESIAAASTRAVDAYHRQFKADTWVRGGGAVGELLVDLTADARHARGVS